jgi:hypothetical protein
VPDPAKLYPFQPEAVIPNGYSLPAVTIPLDAMSQWIEYININNINGNDTDEKTTVTLIGGAGLKETLKLAIPAFGIGSTTANFENGAAQSDYAEGEAEDEAEGGNLVFTATSKTKLKPKEDTVKIYLLLVKVPSKSGSYPVIIDLKWTEAQVNPGESGIYSGKVTLPLGQFSKTLAKYKPVTVPSYLYVGGPFDNVNDAWITLSDGQNLNIKKSIKKDHSFSNYYDELPSKEGADPYNEEIRYDTTASFNLVEKVKEGKDLLLDYSLEVKSWTVTADDDKSKITADLVILLPMRLKVEPDTTLNHDDQTYIHIMDIADYGGNGDLFGRDQAGISNSRITSVRISGKDMVNTVLAGDLFLRIYDDGASFNQLVETNLDEGFSIDIAGAAIPMPFQPKFAVYVKKPENEDAVVSIKAKKDDTADEFSVKLSIDVDGEVEYERDL